MQVPQSGGAHWGQFNVLVRAYTYIRALGNTGLRNVSETAILSAELRELRDQQSKAGDLPDLLRADPYLSSSPKRPPM